MTRRRLATLLSVTPLAAQIPSPPVTQKAPPVGAPAPSPTAVNADEKLKKANDGIRKMSERLAQLEVPMDVEPSFVFKP
jgi:hypothetical protein